MKKLFPVAALLLGTQLAHAQTPIKAGTVLLGGGINYVHNAENTTSSYVGNNNYTTSYSSNSLSLSPYVGIFVADNLAVGLSTSYATGDETYSSSLGTNGSTTRNLSSQFRVGAFGQYYRMLTEHFGLTGTLSGGYEHDVRAAATSSPNSYGLDAKGFYAGLTPAIVFFPIPKISVGASIGGLNYTRLSITPNVPNLSSNYEDIASTFGANFGLNQLTFSGTYFFGR